MSSVATQFKPGWQGGPGRAKGSRNKLQKNFVEALAADFEEHGIGAIRIVRVEEPARYLQIISSVLPREFVVETSLDGIDDDELETLITRAKQQLLAAPKPPIGTETEKCLELTANKS